MIAFDPTWDVETHLHADACDGPICTPMVWRVDVYGGERGMWRCVLSDARLAAWVQACRDVVLLPISGVYREVAELTRGELEAALVVRAAAARRRRRYAPGGDEGQWTPESFRASVEGRCGHGRPKGKEVWFRCPFGTHEDRNASLEVNFDRMLFHCWSCGVAGGYVEWDRRLAR